MDPSASSDSLTALAALLPCGVMTVAWGIICISWIISIAGIVLWILMLVDVIQRKEEDFPNKSNNEKVIWLVIVILTSWVGAVVYYFSVYKKTGKTK